MPSANARTASRIGSASGGRSTERARRTPARVRSVTATAASSASTIAPSAAARRRYRWASCSHVKPIPPCTWMFRLAHRSAAGMASAAAIAAVSENWSPPAEAARAASHTAAVASSVATSMLAQWCFTAWNMAIGRPNWWRSLAYAAADSVHSRATPTASAEKIVRAMSTSIWRAPGSTSAAAPSKLTRPARRVGSRFGGDSTVTPPADTSTTATSSPTATRRTSARPAPITAPAEPCSAPSRSSTSPARATARARRAVGETGEQLGGERRRAPRRRARRWRPPSARTRLARPPGRAARRPPRAPPTRSPEPPCSSGTCRPSQPSAAASAKKLAFGLVGGFQQRPRRRSGVVLGQEVADGVGERSVVLGDGDRHVR